MFGPRAIAALLCFVALLVAAKPLAGDSPPDSLLRVDASRDHVGLGPVLWVLEDPGGELSYDDVIGPARDGFRPLARETLNAGYSSSAFWLRCELELPSDSSEWLVELGFTQLDDVAWFIAAPREAPRVVRTGDRTRFDSRGLAEPSFVLELPRDMGPRLQLHLRVRSSGSVLVPLSLWQQDAYVAESGRRALGWGAYYGFLLALALYNLCLYVVVRERTYLFYIGYLVSLIGFQGSLSGHAFQYLWPDVPACATVSAGTFLALCVALATLFIREMANVAVTAPRLHRPMAWVAAVLLGTVPALWLDYSLAIRAVTVLAVLAVGLLTVPIFAAFRRGYRPARYLVLTIALILPSGLLLGLRTLGMVPETFLTEHAVQFATAAEALVLSFALADRISLLREQALAAQRDLSGKLIAAQDAERQRIAAELHDGLGQNVLVLANGLTRLAERRADASELASLAKQAVSEIRTVAHDLHPGKLDRMGLATALESTVEQALAAAAITGDCSVASDVEESLSPEARLHVYRIVQEAVGNAIKHATATEISVRVRRAGDQLELRVEDDGGGVSRTSVAGLGLASIEERARLLGGRVRVVSSPGEGTRVEVDVPIEGAAGDAS